MIVLIKFVVSMASNFVLESHTVEEEHTREAIPMMLTNVLGK